MEMVKAKNTVEVRAKAMAVGKDKATSVIKHRVTHATMAVEEGLLEVKERKLKKKRSTMKKVEKVRIEGIELIVGVLYGQAVFLSVYGVLSGTLWN